VGRWGVSGGTVGIRRGSAEFSEGFVEAERGGGSTAGGAGVEGLSWEALVGGG
jgi:hypothetical protein